MITTAKKGMDVQVDPSFVLPSYVTDVGRIYAYNHGAETAFVFLKFKSVVPGGQSWGFYPKWIPYASLTEI